MGSQSSQSLGLECILVPQRVSLAQPAEVMLALPAGRCRGNLCHGQSQPHGELHRTMPDACSNALHACAAYSRMAGDAAGLPHRCKCFPAAVFSFYLLFQKQLNFSSALFLTLVKSLAVLQDKRECTKCT